MEWLQVLVLAAVQGLTKFLPVSSSAYLVLVPVLSRLRASRQAPGEAGRPGGP